MNNHLIKNSKIEDMIYEIRGVQVMLDSDLAKLYHCKNGTKSLNLAVRRHINRFPERFMFQLNDVEISTLRFQIETSRLANEHGGRRYNPYVFTEQGVAMLATVLKTEVAEEMSIKIMDAFIAMRHYIGNNEYRLSNVETKILEHDNRIDLIEESLDKLEEKKKENDIYFVGQIYDAYSKILDIFNEAKEELIIIDSYADKNLLNIIKNLKLKVIIITKENNLLTKQDIEKYNKQYSNLKVIYNNTYHDRFFVLDKRIIYHCGTSLNSIGKKTFAINLFTNKAMINTLMDEIKTIV